MHPPHSPLSFHGRFIVVDDEQSVRGTLCEELGRAGVAVYPAESHDLAIRMVENDAGIHVVIFDHGHAGESLEDTVVRMRGIRPDLTLVGMSGSDRRAEFSKLGVGLFLQKPWTVAQLTDLLQDITPRS